jgi:hypothetical protein
MPTPSKPHLVLATEKKSHRTKAELKQRKQAEDALLTGKHMRIWPEVAADEIAKKEFNRVKGLLKKINKDDALHEALVNRYALLRSECLRFEAQKERVYNDLDELEEARIKQEIEFMDYLDNKQKLYGQIMGLDKQIQAKRKMLLDIEKENIMTIASALRSIPKKVEKKDQASGVAGFLNKRNGAGG